MELQKKKDPLINLFFPSLMEALKAVTLEPVMLIDGACNQAMMLLAENVQMNKICTVNLNISAEVCSNLSSHHEENILVQRELSIFAFYNSIIMSVLPFLIVLFMGAWSDRYGRKIPLLLTFTGHLFYAGGYLLNNWQRTWPVEVIYLVTFLEALGGGYMCLLSIATSYVSDICSEESRTSRVSTATSFWYLGGPLGTLLGAIVLSHSGYNLALGLVFMAYVSAICYILTFVRESHGPFAQEMIEVKGRSSDESQGVKREEVATRKMFTDFFNWRRLFESFKTAFRKREGNTRVILVVVIVCNMLWRMSRGFYVYLFVRRTLQWDATDFGYYLTYRNLIAAAGSLVLVPLLTRLVSISDTFLVILGSVSIVGEYGCYGFISGARQKALMWLGPPIGVLSNASVIAFRSMSTKLVSAEEKGRISAVLAALYGLMPMAGYAVYAPIYYNTVETFPAAQFFFAAGVNALIMLLFIAIQFLFTPKVAKEAIEQEGNAKKAETSDKMKVSTVTLSSVIGSESLDEGS
ncbi:lysosomal proton-coupled steroid conjugate and bile acid symporter SLC46A3-like [Penaeus indicus]|uniref:lysosomal proton-coupled steroid conjugate and bile acid symporter SLC46A3-like n=1 Tax=Penaeus indicus TaxID=29960 RepID=UPI00300D11F6